MILLTDEEIQNLTGHTTSYEPKETQINYSLISVRKIAKEQLKKVIDQLKQKTVKAWGGNRIILSEDWEAILKEVE